jgi:GrpB-like predicted nucleotidyltransferase (UPF0157 family)
MLGQYKRNIAVVPYQSGWKELFEREADLLRSALGKNALCIEHIGSTSIPGMASKPILDIMVMVAVVSLTQATELIPVIEALGYEFKSHDTILDRMFFVKEHPPENRTHSLSLVTQGSGFWKDHLAFRDYLRAHDQIAAEYADLKKRLAEEYARTNYIDPDGKSEFVARVLELAEKEERESS